MKKHTDKIEKLLAAYPQLSAQRIAKEKKIKDREKAKEAARKLLERNVKKKITDVFRPVMQQLLARLDKTYFSTKGDELGFMPDILEQYAVDAVKEEDVRFWIALSLTYDEKKPCLTYAYSTYRSSEKVFDKLLALEEIDEELITSTFLLCLKKICI